MSMNIRDVKVGQRVKVIDRGGAFYDRNFGKVGTVEQLSGSAVYVRFDHDGERDYGAASELELVAQSAVEAKTVKAAIANVEQALAALKALVG